jgi:uncharacterized protein
MRAFLAQGVRTTWRALRVWPDGRVWALAVLIGGVLALALAALGLATGRLVWTPERVLPGDALLLLVVPALTEELLFRGLLTGDRLATPSVTLAVLPGLGLYVLWHPVQSLWLPAAAPVLTDPMFLLCVALLGVVLGVLRWASGSLWPGIFLHWAVVLGWQTLLGGPSLRALAV